MGDIDPVEFGKLVGNVEALSVSLKEMQTNMKDMTDRMNTGKGLVLGMLIASSAIGGTVGAFSHKLLESWVK